VTAADTAGSPLSGRDGVPHARGSLPRSRVSAVPGDPDGGCLEGASGVRAGPTMPSAPFCADLAGRPAQVSEPRFWRAGRTPAAGAQTVAASGVCLRWPVCPRCCPLRAAGGSPGAADRTAATVLGVRDAGGAAAGVRTALSTADTAAACGCPPATGTGRLAGVRWWDAASATTPGRPGGRAVRGAARARRSLPAAPTPAPPRPSARLAAGR
jgi:hypothetical protein